MIMSSAMVKHTRRILSIGSLAVVLACSSPAEPATQGRVLTIENRTSSTLVVFYFQNATLVDPVPVLLAGTFANNMVRPFRSLVVDSIPGYSVGSDVVLFLYQVQPDGSAAWLGSQVVTAGELSQGHGLIRISALPRGIY